MKIASDIGLQKKKKRRRPLPFSVGSFNGLFYSLIYFFLPQVQHLDVNNGF